MMAITRLVLLTVLCDCNTLRRCLLVYLTHHHLRFTARTLIPHTKTYISNGGELFCALKPIDFFCFSPHSRWTTLILSFQWSWMEVFTRYGFHRVYNSTLKMMACLLASVQKDRTPECCPGRFDLCLQKKLLHTFSHYHNQTLRSTQFSCIF